MEFGRDFSKWYIARAAAGVWHVFPPLAEIACTPHQVKQFDSGARAIAAFNRGHR